jgi:hypothetical protein
MKVYLETTAAALDMTTMQSCNNLPSTVYSLLKALERTLRAKNLWAASLYGMQRSSRLCSAAC